MASMLGGLRPAILLCLVAAASVSSAPRFGAFGLHASIAFPTGDFAEMEGYEAGLAKQGYSFGAVHAIAMGPSPAFAWVTDLSFLGTPVDARALREALENSGIHDSLANPGTWFNVPIMTGIRYRAGESAAFFWQMQAGMDWAKHGAWFGRSSSVETAWDLAGGYSLGMGLILTERLTVGLRYQNLGGHEMAAEATSAGGNLKGKTRVDIALFTLDAGFMF